jgi:hypothetical protein
MFKPVRIVATILFIASVALVFVGAFVLKSGVRYLSFLWALSSFISFSLLAAMHKYAIIPFALLSKSPALSFCFTVFVIIEFLAYTWYTLSYIPYARTAVLKMVGMG